MGFDSLSIHTSFSVWILMLFFIVLSVYSWYVYRYTIPEVPKFKRILLASLRGAVLLLLIFIAAEPVVTVITKGVQHPEHVVFIDNSTSVVAGQKGALQKAFIEELLAKQFDAHTRFFTFANTSKPVSNDSLQFVLFNGKATNFSGLYTQIKKLPVSPASITIVSDGIRNEGSDPTFAAEKAGIPVFSIIVGDSTKHRDVIVSGLEVPDIMVAGTQYLLRAQITAQGIESGPLHVVLQEEGKNVAEQTVVPDRGYNAVSLAFTPKSAGEKKLQLLVDSVKGEVNQLNNSFTKFVKVRDSKTKVLLIAGSPTADFSFLRNALSEDTNLVVRTIIEVGTNKFVEPYSEKTLDSCSMYFFIGYPTASSTPQLFQQLMNRIRENQKSFFIQIPDNYSVPMLEQLADYLPAKVRKGAAGALAVQPVQTPAGQRHPVIKSVFDNAQDLWSELPPIMRANIDVLVKPESEVLLNSRIGNTPLNLPLLVSRNIGKQRSMLLAGREIWRWQLNSKNLSSFFTSFALNSFRWVQAGSERERLQVQTTKKIYNRGEKVLFQAELYDESFNLQNDAQIGLEIKYGADIIRPVFSQTGAGLYEASFEPGYSGDYQYSATYKEENRKPLQKSGRFSVSEVDLELNNLEADYGFMAYLAKVTGGKCFYNSYQGYFEALQTINQSASVERTERSEYVLRNIPLLAGLIILLLATEWFIRKRAGML